MKDVNPQNGSVTEIRDGMTTRIDLTMSEITGVRCALEAHRKSLLELAIVANARRSTDPSGYHAREYDRLNQMINRTRAIEEKLP